MNINSNFGLLRPPSPQKQPPGTQGRGQTPQELPDARKLKTCPRQAQQHREEAHSKMRWCPRRAPPAVAAAAGGRKREPHTSSGTHQSLLEQEVGLEHRPLAPRTPTVPRVRVLRVQPHVRQGRPARGVSRLRQNKQDREREERDMSHTWQRVEIATLGELRQ